MEMSSPHGFVFMVVIIMSSISFKAALSQFSHISGIVEMRSSIYHSNIPLDPSSLQDYLEQMLQINVTSLNVEQNDWKNNTNLRGEFQGLLDNSTVLPPCLRNNTLNGNGNTSGSYTILSISFQNFPNASVLEDHCLDGGRKLVFLEHLGENCIHNTNMICDGVGSKGAFQYNLYETATARYSVYCLNVSKEKCLIDDWSRVILGPQCNVRHLKINKPYFPGHHSFRFTNDYGSEMSEPPFQLNCTSFEPYAGGGGPPIILLSGDQTWNLLPQWLKICLRVINGFALAVFLLCLLNFALFPELRNAHGKIAMSLVIAAMISLFYTSGYIPLEPSNTGVCILIGTLLYYFVLVPNYWWLSLAIFLAWNLARPGIHRMDEESGKKMFIILSFFGWGTPLAFTLLALILQVSGITVFTLEKHCWVDPGWPLWFLSALTLAPFCLECVLFGLVVYRLCETRKSMRSFKHGGKSGSANDILLTVKMTATFGVFWLPCWITYIISLIVPTQALAIVTQILNQLSILGLPLVLCFSKNVAKLWNKKLTPLRKRFSSSSSAIQSKLHSEGHEIQENSEKVGYSKRAHDNLLTMSDLHQK